MVLSALGVRGVRVDCAVYSYVCEARGYLCHAVGLSVVHTGTGHSRRREMASAREGGAQKTRAQGRGLSARRLDMDLFANT